MTLGQLSERGGRIKEAIGLFTVAQPQARDARVLGVELRAAYQLARTKLERGDLPGAVTTAHQGVRAAEEKGLGLAPYGLDLQYLHYLAHYQEGSWDHAAARGRVPGPGHHRRRGPALGHGPVRRGGPGQPGGGRAPGLAGAVLGRGPVQRVHRARAARRARAVAGRPRGGAGRGRGRARHEADKDGYGPPVIRVAAIGLSAHANRAVRARAAGDTRTEKDELKAAKALIAVARQGAAYPRQPKFVLGIDGRGWLARAEAEWRRARGKNSPAAWQSVVDTFGPAFVYEAARARWRLAEALAEKGQRERAAARMELAMETVDRPAAARSRC